MNSTPSLRDRLKLETKDLHSSVESAMGSHFLKNRQDYIQRLKDFAGLHWAFERKLSQLPEDSPLKQFYQGPRHKSFWLMQDLKHLDPESSPDQIEGRELFTGWGEDQLWGAVYVIEGSTLGGQIISRELTQSLGLHRETGASFFSSYGEDTGRRWKEFLATLADQEKNKLDPQKVVQGARDTFGFFESQFKRS